MTTTTIATPQKLRSGEWGARVQGEVSEGDTVTIRTRSGKEWQARVTRVVWSGEGVSICATASLDRPAAPRYAAGGSARDCDGRCRCHREPGAGRPGTTLYDGCDRCGCEAF